MDVFHRKFFSGKYTDPSKQQPDDNTQKPAQGPDRPVDVVAGKGSLADTLRKQRKAIEGGDPSGGKDPNGDY